MFDISGGRTGEGSYGSFGGWTTWIRPVVARRRARGQDDFREAHQRPRQPQFRHLLPPMLPAQPLEMQRDVRRAIRVCSDKKEAQKRMQKKF